MKTSMIMSQHRLRFSATFRNPALQICTTPLAVAGLVAIAIPTPPAVAYTPFQICTAQLVRYASVTPDKASVACANALNPADYSRCVVTISERTPAVTDDAITACTRVRRPVELSTCVVDITNRSRDSQVPTVLDYCRRSLLPIRFSECVNGLSSEVDSATPKALDTCIAAEDYPRQLFPNFAPPPSSQPTLPTVPNVSPSLNPATIKPPMPVTPVQP
ncbi:MAG: hypothetical protein ABI417_12400 [Coleofasciculaceae cyanobacterium]